MKREKIVIDLTNKDLNEGLYTQFANNMRSLLLDLYFAGFDAPLSLKGTQEQIDAFFRALKREKRYMDSYIKHGLNDNRTISDRHQLMNSVQSFERETGLRWPFKN
tara:strand:+ start:101 stop:418 length:318 start_codon:yes stop_codon:yes gene_type:complete